MKRLLLVLAVWLALGTVPAQASYRVFMKNGRAVTCKEYRQEPPYFLFVFEKGQMQINSALIERVERIDGRAAAKSQPKSNQVRITGKRGGYREPIPDEPPAARNNKNPNRQRNRARRQTPQTNRNN